MNLLIDFKKPFFRLLSKIIVDFFYCVFYGFVLRHLGLKVMAKGELLAIVADEPLTPWFIEFCRLIFFYIMDKVQGKLQAVYFKGCGI